MRNKKSATTIDMYKQYKKNIDDQIDYSTYQKVLQLFNQAVLDCLLQSSDGVKLPSGLGYVQVVKYKPKTYSSKSLSVDYKASKEIGKTIYHLNEHSNGYKYRLYWSKLPRTFADRYKYSLSFVRQNKRRLAQLIFNNHDYINIDDIQIYKM